MQNNFHIYSTYSTVAYLQLYILHCDEFRIANYRVLLTVVDNTESSIPLAMRPASPRHKRNKAGGESYAQNSVRNSTLYFHKPLTYKSQNVRVVSRNYNRHYLHILDIKLRCERRFSDKQLRFQNYRKFSSRVEQYLEEQMNRI